MMAWTMTQLESIRQGLGIPFQRDEMDSGEREVIKISCKVGLGIRRMMMKLALCETVKESAYGVREHLTCRHIVW